MNAEEAKNKVKQYFIKQDKSLLADLCLIFLCDIMAFLEIDKLEKKDAQKLIMRSQLNVKTLQEIINDDEDSDIEMVDWSNKEVVDE